MGGRIKGKGTYVFLWLIHVDILQKLLLRNNFPLKKKKKRNNPPNKSKVFKEAEREKQIPYSNIYMWNLEK